MSEPGDSTLHYAPGFSQRASELRNEFVRHLESGREPQIEPFLERADVSDQELLLGELRKTAIAYLRSLGRPDPVSIIEGCNPTLRTRLESLRLEESEANETDFFTPSDQGPPPSRQRRRSRGLHIRCPHCSNPVELVADTPLDSIDCTVCGSAFSLVDRSVDTRMAATLQKIARFELVARLGVGGFGTVWKARDTELDRVVAVKIPRQGQLLPSEMEQFFREARSVAQLRHPNIVPVHEVGREEDTIFIVSDFIRGVSLADRMTGDPMTPREAATMCATIADALEHAHARGVIHRDLKPSNVMLDEEDVPYLMDFGLAKRETEEVAMTMEGQVLGTPAYMSPEQAQGKSAWADRRTDIYSLGVMLFEMLTSELPFRGNAQMQVHQRQREDAPSVLSLNRHLPKDLATICAKCLEREPGNRYPTAKAVAEELRRHLDGIPILARPISPIERGVRWVQRHPMPAAVVALVTLLAIAGPTVAVVIAGKNALLEAKNSENTNLILARTEEGKKAKQEAAQLRSELDFWEGKGNSWALWPPDAGQPPRKRQMSSLLAASESSLRSTPQDEPPADTARRLLALATLYELSEPSRAKEALPLYKDAARVLERVPSSETTLELSLALADCYDRLSTLVAPDDHKASQEWLKKSLAVCRQLAEAHPRDPRLQAMRLESELRTSAQGAFDNPGEDLNAVATIQKQLSTLWPTAPDEVYALACELAGRPAWLTKGEENQNEAAADSSAAIGE